MKHLIISIIIVLGLGVSGVASAVNEWFGYLQNPNNNLVFQSDEGYGSPVAAVNGAQCDALKLAWRFEGIDRFGTRPADGTYIRDVACISNN